MIKKKVIITILTLSITIGGIFSVYAINKNINNNKEITATALNIKKVYTKFNIEQDRSNKINDLKTMVLALNNNKLKSEIIVKDYNEKIKNMKQYFTNDYDKKLGNNSFKSGNKDILVQQVTNLNALLHIVKSERDVVLDNINEYTNYEKKINEIVKNDTENIQVIDVAIKAAADKKSKEEADKKAIAAAKVVADKKIAVAKVAANKKAAKSNSKKVANNTNNSTKTYNNTATKSVAKASTPAYVAPKKTTPNASTGGRTNATETYTQNGVTSTYTPATGQHSNTNGQTWTDDDLGDYK